MVATQFIDRLKLFFRSGKGGAGAVHFRREKFIPKGGPDGGDGGKGGSIILQGNKQLSTLLHLKYRRHIRAPDGNPGGAQCAAGKNGEDLIVFVPLGTTVKNAETEELEGEITQHGEQLIIFAGGRGGKGNHFFKRATHQTPRFSQEGEPYREGWKLLELKLLADIGLVGTPNAGKSTFLSVISAAQPAIGPYPFTTLTPNLGVVSYDKNNFVVADMPGIIQGASKGRGLGIQFLRHIERNKIFAFVLPADEPEPINTYNWLLKELESYSPDLLKKRRMVIISKIDLVKTTSAQKKIFSKFPKELPVIAISSIKNEGIEKVKQQMLQELSFCN